MNAAEFKEFEKFYSPEEVAHIFGVTEKQVIESVKNGQITAVEVFGTVRIHKSEVMRLYSGAIETTKPIPTQKLTKQAHEATTRRGRPIELEPEVEEVGEVEGVIEAPEAPVPVAVPRRGRPSGSRRAREQMTTETMERVVDVDLNRAISVAQSYRISPRTVTDGVSEQNTKKLAESIDINPMTMYMNLPVGKKHPSAVIRWYGLNERQRNKVINLLKMHGINSYKSHLSAASKRNPDREPDYEVKIMRHGDIMIMLEMITPFIENEISKYLTRTMHSCLSKVRNRQFAKARIAYDSFRVLRDDLAYRIDHGEPIATADRSEIPA